MALPAALTQPGARHLTENITVCRYIPVLVEDLFPLGLSRGLSIQCFLKWLLTIGFKAQYHYHGSSLTNFTYWTERDHTLRKYWRSHKWPLRWRKRGLFDAYSDQLVWLYSGNFWQQACLGYLSASKFQLRPNCEEQLVYLQRCRIWRRLDHAEQCQPSSRQSRTFPFGIRW